MAWTAFTLALTATLQTALSVEASSRHRCLPAV